MARSIQDVAPRLTAHCSLTMVAGAQVNVPVRAEKGRSEAGTIVVLSIATTDDASLQRVQRTDE